MDTRINTKLCPNCKAIYVLDKPVRKYKKIRVCDTCLNKERREFQITLETVTPYYVIKFLRSFQKAERGCWIWVGAKDNNGYGRFTVKRKNILAHRLSYLLYYQTLPSDLFVLHSCDNPSCISPFHLSLGTQLENMQQAKQRNRMALGAKCASTKLLESEVMEIKSLLREKVSQAEIAKRFNVTPSTISLINSGKNWAYI